MTSVLFDTQAAVDSLTEGGFTPEQARANVKFVRNAIEGGVATKSDVQDASTKASAETQAVKSELQAEIQALRTELKAEIKDVRNELEKLSLRMTILVLGTSGLLGAFLKFFPG